MTTRNLVQVIRDPRDVTLDIYIDGILTRTMHKNGELAWDVTNKSYSMNKEEYRNYIQRYKTPTIHSSS